MACWIKTSDGHAREIVGPFDETFVDEVIWRGLRPTKIQWPLWVLCKMQHLYELNPWLGPDVAARRHRHAYRLALEARRGQRLSR